MGKPTSVRFFEGYCISLSPHSSANAIDNDQYICRYYHQFVTGDETVVISPTAEVRQGDALSTAMFNLAAKPIVRAAKSQINARYECFHETIKTSAFADGIVVIADGTLSIQRTLDRVSAVARLLSLEFNADKCACSKGRNNPATLLVQGQPIRMLRNEYKENYLGIPLGPNCDSVQRPTCRIS
jgi:Reverse transcriptase (RNA-dependent DNA polymerase)